MDTSDIIEKTKKQRLSIKLQEMGAKYGNNAVIDIVASYADALTQKGRDALIQAIKDCDPHPQHNIQPLFRVKEGVAPYPGCAGVFCQQYGGNIGLVMLDVMGQPFVWYREQDVKPCRMLFRDEVNVLYLWGYQDSDLAPYLKAKAA